MHTTREFVYLVRRGLFRSCDKYGSHTIRFTIAENPFTVLPFPLGLTTSGAEAIHQLRPSAQPDITKG